MNDPDAPPVPLWRTFVWAGVWLLLFAISLLAIFAEWPRVLSPEHRGVRVDGFLFLNPPLFLALSVLCLVLALRRAPRVSEFNARYSAEERRELRRLRLVGEAWKPLVVIAAIIALLGLAGVVGLGWFLVSPAVNPTGFWLLLEVLVLITALWVPLLWVGLTRRSANRA